MAIECPKLEDLKQPSVSITSIQERRAALAKIVVEKRDAITALTDDGKLPTDEQRNEFAAACDAHDIYKQAEDYKAQQRDELQELINRGDIELRDFERSDDPAGGRREHSARPFDQLTFEQREAVVADALRGWTKSQFEIEPTETERRAVERMGARLGSDRFEIRLGNVEQRAASTQQLSTGGAVVGATFSTEFEHALQAFGGVRAVARTIRTQSGEDFHMSQVNDVANVGSLVAENNDSGSATDLSLARFTLRAHKYTTGVALVSREMIDDPYINFAAELGMMLGERMGRIQAQHFTTGDGADKPFGIVNGAAAGVTAAAVDALAADELIDLQHTIDPAYRGMDPAFMMADSTLQAVRKLKDGAGQYLWQPGLSAGVGSTLLGWNYRVNQDMAAIATGNVVLLAGVFSKYIIRDVRSLVIRRLEERYAELDQVGFVGFLRTDGRLKDAGGNPVTKLTMA